MKKKQKREIKKIEIEIKKKKGVVSKMNNNNN